MARPLPFGAVLAVGAHCDDIEIGCGGTLSRLARDGIPTYGLVVTDTHYERNGVVVRDGAVARKEMEAAARVIGYQPIFCDFRNNDIVVDEKLVYAIRDVVEKYSVDTVLTHWSSDAHLDHVRVAQATVMATRDRPNLLMYRSNNFPSADTFVVSVSVDITQVIDRKIDALRCYEMELRRVGTGFVDSVVQSNRYDGLCARVGYAETFFSMKCVL